MIFLIDTINLMVLQTYSTKTPVGKIALYEKHTCKCAGCEFIFRITAQDMSIILTGTVQLSRNNTVVLLVIAIAL